MNNKNVLMVIDSLIMGGAERIILTLSELFIAENINVHILTIYDKIEYEINEKINIHTINYKKKFFQTIIYRYKLRKKIKEIERNNNKKFDLILVHLLKASKLMKGYEHPHIYYVIHNALSKKMFKGLSQKQKNKKLLRIQKKYNNENIITVSEGVKKDILYNLGINVKSIQVIYNPINLKMINKLAKEINPVDLDQPYILHVGSFTEQKRHDILIDCYIKSKIDAKLVLLGDGKMREKIEEQIKNLKQESNIILLGQHNNPYPIIKGASILVLSSDFEGLPTVILEALALNVPVVSRDSPFGPKEILENFLECSISEYNDLDDFANKINEQYINRYPIKKDVLNRFNGKNVINQYMKLMD